MLRRFGPSRTQGNQTKEADREQNAEHGKNNPNDRHSFAVVQLRMIVDLRERDDGKNQTENIKRKSVTTDSASDGKDAEDKSGDSELIRSTR